MRAPRADVAHFEVLDCSRKVPKQGAIQKESGNQEETHCFRHFMFAYLRDCFFAMKL